MPEGVLVVPDFIANAGGVICAAMEYAGATQRAAFDAIGEKIRANTGNGAGEVKGGAACRARRRWSISQRGACARR